MTIETAPCHATEAEKRLDRAMSRLRQEVAGDVSGIVLLLAIEVEDAARALVAEERAKFAGEVERVAALIAATAARVTGNQVIIDRLERERLAGSAVELALFGGAAGEA